MGSHPLEQQAMVRTTTCPAVSVLHHVPVSSGSCRCIRLTLLQGDWLKFGAILSVFYLAVWLGIGGAWWKVIGLW